MKRFLSLIAGVFLVTANVNAEVVSQWSFDDNLNDTAPGGVNADNLTNNAGATYVDGVVGRAVNIPVTADGSNKLSATDSADLNIGSAWTFEAFVYPTSAPDVEWERIWTKWGEGGEEYHMSFRGATGSVVVDGVDLFVNGADNIINHNSTAPVPRDEWSHFAFVGDEGVGTITAWLNGVEVGTTGYVAVPATAGNMNFANFGDGNQAVFQYAGYIDEAMIHNTAVDAAYLQSRAALIPEPSTSVLVFGGMLGLLGLRRRS